MTETTKKDQLIFLEGKTIALQKLFNGDNFGYLAIGYEDEINNGFTNNEPNGFVEITQDNTYQRIPLAFVTDKPDDTTGRTVCVFTATLETSNITNDTPINQFAVCDKSDKDNANTKFYAASTFPTFTKNDNIEISFTVEFGI